MYACSPQSTDYVKGDETRKSRGATKKPGAAFATPGSLVLLLNY